MSGNSLINRRTFLVASSVGFAGFRFGSLAHTAPLAPIPPGRRQAKTTILFFLCGGASHIDTWDMKPAAPAEYRGPFQAIRTTAPDIQLCEHLPRTAKQAHHLAILRSITDGGKTTGDHHAGYYYNLTGRVPDLTFRTQGNDRRPYPDDWPFMGSVVGAARAAHPSLPQVITLPHKPSRAPYTRPGQFAARLGVQHDPFYLYGDIDNPTSFLAPSLTLEQGLTPDRLAQRTSLLEALNAARENFDREAHLSLDIQRSKALRLLASTATGKAFDLSKEPDSVRRRYGSTINGMSLLMARRLAEAGVPFITVFWKENEQLRGKCRSAGGWDTHGNNFGCLREFLLPEFDQAFSALLEDLDQKNMLEETLVVVSSEMGRKPKIGDRRSGGVAGAGRDHWTACMSVLMAGGGIQGGQVFGRTDKVAEYPVEQVISPAEVTRTVYHAMGIDEFMIEDNQGRPFNLLDDSRPLVELF